MSEAVPDDTRGIVDPGTMARIVTLERFPAGPHLDGLIDWFWAVRWQLPDGIVHEQRVLNHPSANLSIGTVDDAGATPTTPGGRLYGPLTSVSTRRLCGDGWTVAAKTTTGGLGAFLDSSVARFTDRAVPLSVVGLDDGLVATVAAAGCLRQRVDLLREAMVCMLATRAPEPVEQARFVARVARLAETDRGIRRLEDLASRAGVSGRTLQRLFEHHAGVSPVWVIRRWRIIEAVERAGRLEKVSWRGMAADLGYADQAHLVRDFTAHLGMSPTAYRSKVRLSALCGLRWRRRR